MAEYKLNAALREGVGKNKVKKLRAEELVPAVYYAKGKENMNIQISERELRKVYLEAGHTNIIDLVVGNQIYKAIFKEVKKHPFKNQYVHVDFLGIRMDQPIVVMVPIMADGRDEIRVQPSVLMQHLNELEIECLPADIPDEITIDVREMQIGDSVSVADLDIVKNDKYNVLTDPETSIVSLQEPREEVIEDDEEVDASEVPTVDETEEREENSDEE